MEKVFGVVLHLSLIGSYTFLLVLILRFLMLKVLHCSRKLIYGLWLLVALNFCVPTVLQSPFSLIPSSVETTAQNLENRSYELSGTIHQLSGTDQESGRKAQFPDGLQEMQQSNLTGTEIGISGQSKSTWNWSLMFRMLWLAGIVVLLIQQAVSTIKLKAFLSKNLCVRSDSEQRIREYEKLPAPFVWGVLRPVICLPTELDATEKRYILAHEDYHRKRLDPLWKLLFLLIRTLHWFNPCVWLAYALFCRDMEISCDEAVLQNSAPDMRKDYAASLLKYAAKQNGYAVSSLTFGAPSLKSRIQNVLHYRKKTVGITLIGVIILVAAAVGLFLRPTVPTTESDTEPGTSAETGKTGSETTADHTILGNGSELIAVDGELYTMDRTKLYSDGEYLYYDSWDETDSVSRIWRQSFTDANMEMVSEGELLGSTADGSSLYYDPGDHSVWEYNTASGDTALLYPGNQNPITSLYVDENVVLTAAGHYEGSAGYFYGSFYSYNRKTGETTEAYLTDAPTFVVLNDTVYYQKYFNSPDGENIPYGIYQTDLEFQNETRTALDMTLLGVNEETGDLLAAVEPDYLSSIEPVYTQMDLDAISVANSRGWNQVLVDAGAIFGYTDSVNQTQLINLDGFQYTDYADAEVTSIQYQDISVLGDSLFVRMQLLGHFAKDGANLQESVLREVWLKVRMDGKGAELVDSTIYFPNGDTVNNSMTLERTTIENNDPMDEITNIEPAKSNN